MVQSYKVVKDFGEAHKGDIFEYSPLNEAWIMEREDTTENYNAYSYVKLSDSIVENYVEAGYLVPVVEEKDMNDCKKTQCDEDDGFTAEQAAKVYAYVNTLLDTYEKDYNDMLKSF